DRPAAGRARPQRHRGAPPLEVRRGHPWTPASGMTCRCRSVESMSSSGGAGMTETSHDKPQVVRQGAGQAAPGGNAGRAKDLTIERLSATAGVHPYEEVTGELRDVVQQNWKTGETIFEQRGVEFPDFWSVNASTIVTTKYFRGAVGTEAREAGLKQLIDRVVLTYRRAGEEHGYFA